MFELYVFKVLFYSAYLILGLLAHWAKLELTKRYERKKKKN